MAGGGEAAPKVPRPGRDRRFLTFLGGAASADIGDQAWIVILAYAAAQSGSAVTATLTVAAGTVPRAILELVGGAIADRLPTRPLVVGVAGARVLALAAGLLALIGLPDHTIPIIVGIAVLFGAADALHKPAIFTMPRQIVGVDSVVRAASLRQLVNRLALLGGPALAGAVLAAVALPGAIAGLLAVFLLAAVLLSLVRVRYPREDVERESVLASLRSVVEFLRSDRPSRALVCSMVGLNFFVIPVLNVGVALKAHQEGWSAQVLGILLACVGVGAAIGTLVTLRIKPRHPMRFALALLVMQGFALGLVGLLPMVGVAVSLALVGLTARPGITDDGRHRAGDRANQLHRSGVRSGRGRRRRADPVRPGRLRRGRRPDRLIDDDGHLRHRHGGTDGHRPAPAAVAQSAAGTAGGHGSRIRAIGGRARIGRS
ncbi:MFS transporter [Microlunatus sp. Gsoil 973]|uniref:MFS transporter n=1 Tax=Microlunatus sp. Gsoil 973 TaxID=2672569 RepID=UPI001E5B4183|nr:MFS transporter [Microlunatus sp. Gsoil 973]